METLNISISQGKIKGSRIGLSILFLVMCVLFYLGWANHWEIDAKVILIENIFVMLALGLCVIITGYGCYWMIFKLDSSKPALILEDDGYTDNVGLLKGQKYLYKDIDRFEDKTVNMNRCIVVFLKDVDAFLDAQSGMKKKLLKASYTQMGSPISIPARGFDYKFEDLLSELNKRLDASR